ncbi:phosphonate ABC transporter, permease protein PhnE [Flexivirga caeni]|uniref:Phosphonate ABC transporter, permease protein PhnE n=1 Tax=Flexivirga caeni TaxID=2294115 RepID=A0A3M9LXN2_9MICO|nr:phosphonate ABC transporter, permease protein PhnE [Flexivirga caeni]RNI18069.1 phosphonate ABC transporter, permease protein PhnE [Flexivirga caeni]
MTTPTAIPAGKAVPPPRPSRLWVRAGWTAVLLVVLAAFWRVNIDWSQLSDFVPSLFHYLRLMFCPPAWSQTSAAFSATILSVQMAWIGSILGILISFPLSFLAARNVVPVWVRLPVRLVLAILRAVPEVVIAILILSVTGLTAWTGALALGIGSIGTLGKWGYESFESVSGGPLEAARATGGSRLAVIRWGLWPQAQPEVLAFWLYRFEISVRSSAILGLIGAGGIGKMLSDNTQYQNWNVVGILLIVVVVVTMIIDQISAVLRQRLITGRWALVGYGARRKALTPTGLA